MGNPKGSNAGTVGVKGRSGRKSAYKENDIAQKIINAFEKGVEAEKLLKLREDIKEGKVGNKKIKLIDVVLAKALAGNAELTALLNKLLPDKLEHSGGIDQRVTEINYIVPKEK